MAELKYGLVPHPPFKDRPIVKAEGRGQNNLGRRTVKGVTWHRILGSLWGTDGYFRRADVNALTDYGIGVRAMDGADHAGEILRWNDPLGFQSGWASGPVSSPYGDGLPFVTKYGANAVNQHRASLEISGQQGTPLDPESRWAIAAITAYWADQDEIPWNVFPIRPDDGFSFVCWHDEFTWGTGKRCPFDVVKAETADLIELTRAIMKQYQTQGASEPPPVEEPQFAPLALPDFVTPRWINGGEDAKFENGVKVWSIRRRWTARVETPRLQHSGPNAPAVGPPIKAGESFVALGVYHSHDEWWLLTEFGTRVRMADMSDRFIPGYPDKIAA